MVHFAGEVSLSSEEEPVPSTSSQPPAKRPRRRSSVLAFLKKRAEKDEARDAVLYEQNERLLKALLSYIQINMTQIQHNGNINGKDGAQLLPTGGVATIQATCTTRDT
ncbi:hypothetical protein CesoFtcFv8_010684 [Champsocephalus esox]|uniref:Uncharacterized protein n=1 Tax=Champsocephalus esox TaxID=159716 RepID=A0AAN8H0E4_9TELE|nr:hypothetical protein CesoFtcFv8_010684 [Champsocephalus esox]